MPLLIVAAILLAALVLFIFGIPLSLLLRYRTGKARRLARSWVVTTNLVMLTISMLLFLAGAAFTSLWVPRALAYGLLGLAAGGVLGLLGLVATRWEPTPRGLFFTPNRWLVLLVTLLVTARVGYGIWRAWHTWHHAAGDVAWLDAFGVAESLAAGAVVLGYYLVYVLGVRRRLRADVPVTPVSQRTPGAQSLSRR
ncbi:MAG TPA: DUF1453 domain-containing protein [Thermoanaerobaculia bacterium]|nr:DUF1453 domain-containing protein [Thermoanaerobaculia bacterium]